MKRRKFLKGLAIAPAVLVAGRFLSAQPVNDFKKFWDGVLNDMCIDLNIPKEIIEMEFSKENSMSRQMARFDLARRQEAVINSYFQMVLKK